MANMNGAFGLRPCGKTLSLNPYGIVAGATKIFIGDPVKRDTAGQAGGLSTVTIAAAGDPIVGAVVSIFDAAGTPVGFYPAGSAAGYRCMVADDPMQEFVVQEDSDGAALAQADIGLNANLVSGTGNETTNLSGWMLDSSSKNTTATLQVHIERLMQKPDNEIGDYADWVVKINNHQRGSSTGTAGV